MVHLLRSCSSTRTLSISLLCSYIYLSVIPNKLISLFFFLYTTVILPFSYFQVYLCLSSCPCGGEDRHRIDDVSLNSLEELKLTSYTSSYGQVKFVEYLFRCNAPILRRLVINNMISSDPSLTKERVRRSAAFVIQILKSYSMCLQLRGKCDMIWIF
jgi:hypothetical protein